MRNMITFPIGFRLDFQWILGAQNDKKSIKNRIDNLVNMLLTFSSTLGHKIDRSRLQHNMPDGTNHMQKQYQN
jgi:hypothetical protein